MLAGLEKLEPAERTAVVLRDVLGWDAADVAELLNTSIESLDGLLARARAVYDHGGDRRDD